MWELGVIVPCLDQYSTLSPTLLSIQRQVFDKIVMVLDDSSDPPLDDLVPASVPGCRMEYVRFEEHRGVQACRNEGQRSLQSNCRMILFCDSDVTWKNGAFSRLGTELRNYPEAAYAYCDYDRRGIAGDKPFIAGPFSDEKLRVRPFISTMSMAISDYMIQPAFIENEERLQDWSLWLRMMNSGRRGTYVPEVLFEAHFEDDRHCISRRGLSDYVGWYETMIRRYVRGSQAVQFNCRTER